MPYNNFTDTFQNGPMTPFDESNQKSSYFCDKASQEHEAVADGVKNENDSVADEHITQLDNEILHSSSDNLMVVL